MRFLHPSMQHVSQIVFHFICHIFNGPFAYYVNFMLMLREEVLWHYNSLNAKAKCYSLLKYLTWVLGSSSLHCG